MCKLYYPVCRNRVQLQTRYRGNGHLIDASLVHATNLAAGLVVQALRRACHALLVQLLAQRKPDLQLAASTFTGCRRLSSKALSNRSRSVTT